MSDGLEQIRERLDQSRKTRAADLSARVANGAPVNPLRGGTFFAGDRVFDSVSGLEGVVEPSAPGAAPTSTAVFVRLSSGSLVARPPEQLIARPTPPAAK